MDALTVLRREHTRMIQLFTELSALPDRACLGRRAIVQELDALVRRHIAEEEATVYRRLDAEVETLHGVEEHALAVRLLDQIARTDCRDAMYVPRILLLRDVLLRHIQDEEEVIFPACEFALA